MNAFSTCSFDDLRSGLGRGDGPISMSDMYNIDAVAPRSGPINITNVLGTKTQSDIYSSLHSTTRTNILGMYSTRLVNAQYVGPIVQVKRSSDNVVMDFFSDLSGNIKDRTFTTSYASWIGSNTGYIIKWYDQSGSGITATNSAAPVIPPRLVLDPVGSGRYVVFFPNSKVPDPDLKIQLSFNSTFPSYTSTGGSAPTFDLTSQNDNWVKFNPGAVNSSSTSAQFLNFGAQTFNLGTAGFSFTCQFQFTGSPNTYERLLQLGNGNDNKNSIIISRLGTNLCFFCVDSNVNVLNFITSSTFSQSTTYKIAFVYNPNVGATGTAYFYLNGSFVSSATPTSKLPDMSVTNSWVGRSMNSTDGALNANIYSLKAYNRVLSASEVAAADEYGNNYCGMMISPQNVNSIMCSFYPILTQSTFHTLIAQAGVDLSLRFWADPNAIAGGPWPVGSANNPNYVLYNYNSGDFMNSSSGGYAFFNDVYDNTSPYVSFSGGSWNTLCFSRNSGTIPITYIGQQGNGTPNRSFYGYMGDLILFNSTIPVNTVGEGTISHDYRVFAKRSLGGCKWSDGLIGRYTSDSWTGSVWQDTSGADNHITSITNPGSIVKSGQFIYGGTTTSMTFPAAVITSSNYTLFHVAKYNGANKKRILTAAWSDPDLVFEVGPQLGTTSGWTSTGGTAPTWNVSTNDNYVQFSPGNVTSGSASCQHLNYGSKTFNLGTKGFSATCRFMFTGTLGSFERIFDFGSGADNNNILCTRNFTYNTMRFHIANGSTNATCDATYTFSQNTIYNIAVVYNPAITSNGTMYFYVNGTLQQTLVPSFKAVDRTVAYTYVGRSSWSSDAALNGNIYSLKVYNRVLSAAEITAASQFPSTNWLSGYYNGMSGYAYHGNTQITSALDRHGTNWVISTDQNTLYRSLTANRVAFAPSTNTLAFPMTLTINGNASEASDWAIACIMAFNRKLSLAECLMVEDYLASRYAIAVPIQEGLACSLDAADYVSGTDGTTWRDRSPNGYNFTLSSSSAFVSGSQPYINFDSIIATRTAIPLPPSPAVITLVMFVQLSNVNTKYRALCRGATSSYLLTNINSNSFGYYITGTTNTFYPYDNAVDITQLAGSTSRTNMYAFQLSSTTPYIKFFYNPVSGPLYTTGISSTAATQLQEGISKISHTGEGCGNVSNFILYNRRLADDEMIDMYNRFAPRFNLPTDKTYHSLYSPFMWFRAKDLAASLSHGATVSSWTSFGPVWSHVATGYSAGSGTLPIFDKNSESAPFVRIGTGTNSTSNGSYFDCGSKTFNLTVNGGMTVIAYVRFRSSANNERIIDFGSSSNTTNNNIIFGRKLVSNALAAWYCTGSTVTAENSGPNNFITNGQWQILAMRVTDKELSLFSNNSKSNIANTSLTNRSFSNAYIGKSWWPSSDSYANIDIKDLLVYDRPLTDLQIMNVCNYLDVAVIPRNVMKSTAATARSSIVTDGLQLWLDMGVPESYNPDKSTTLIRDLSGNLNHFTLNGSGYSYNKQLGFLNLNSSSTTYGVGPTGEKFNITVDHTVEFLVRTSGGYDNQILRIMTGNTTTYNEMIGIYMIWSDGRIYYDALNAYPPENRISYSTSSTSGLKHMVARCKTVSGVTYIDLFENNIRKVGPTAIVIPNATWSGITRLFSAENNSINFKNADFYYMRIYNRGLSEDEITRNYIASGGSTPSTVTGLHAWYDMSSSSYVTINANSQVTQLNDRSKNGNHAVQIGTGYCTLASNSIGGLSALQFTTGQNQGFKLQNMTNANTVIAVGKATDSAQNNMFAGAAVVSTTPGPLGGLYCKFYAGGNAEYFRPIKSIVSYYSFNTDYTDALGLYNLTKVGNVTLSTTSKYGGYSAYFANPTNQAGYDTMWLENTSATSALLTSKLTVSFWFNLSTNVTSVWQPVMFWVGKKTSDSAYSLALNANINWGGNKLIVNTCTTGQGLLTLTNNQSITAGTWYHLAITYNGSQMIVYLNGTAISTTNLTGSISYGVGGGGGGGSGDNKLYIGGIGGITSGSAHGWSGYIDEFKVYNRALSASEVVQVQNATSGDDMGESTVSIGPQIATPINTNMIYAGYYTDSLQGLRINGVDDVTVSVSGNVKTIVDNYIGAVEYNRSIQYSSFTGVLSEILFFNRALTTSEIQQIEGYLAHKYNLLGSLPAGHPFKSNSR